MNFGRVVRMAIRYKFTFAATIFSALMVAILWGGIIGAVYPVVEVVFKNKSMQQWIDEQIAENQKNLTAKTSELDQLKKRLVAAEKNRDEALVRETQQQIHNAEDDRTKADNGLWGAKIAKPYIDAYLPAGPFQTLVFITVFLFIGTVVKDFFLVANNVLTSRLSQLATFDLRKMFYRRTLADGPGQLQRRRHRRSDEPIYERCQSSGQGTGRPVRQTDSRAAEDVRLPGGGGVL